MSTAPAMRRPGRRARRPASGRALLAALAQRASNPNFNEEGSPQLQLPQLPAYLAQEAPLISTLDELSAELRCSVAARRAAWAVS